MALIENLKRSTITKVSPASGKKVSVYQWVIIIAGKTFYLEEDWGHDWSLSRGHTYPRCIKLNGNFIGSTISEAKHNLLKQLEKG